MTSLELLLSAIRKPKHHHRAVESPNEHSNGATSREVDSDEDNNRNVPQTQHGDEDSHELNPDKEKHFKIGDCRGAIQAARKLCGKCVNDTRVQIIIILLITVNSIMMGIATYSFVKDNPAMNKAFETTDLVFLIIFTVELALQFIYYGIRFFLDGWLVFDFIIIVTSWSLSGIQVVRAFRIFRAFRLTTRVKVLKDLLTALFSVMPRMGAISLLLFLIFFIFAILMTSLWKDLYQDGETLEDYFGRLDATFFTLFQVLTLDNWASISREVMAVQSWAWLPMIAFILISAFIVVNLVIAVVCDAISALHGDQKASLMGQNTNDEDDDGDDNDQEPIQVDVKEKLHTLERQVEELAAMQEETMHTLQYLTRHLQAAKKVEASTPKRGWL